MKEAMQYCTYLRLLGVTDQQYIVPHCGHFRAFLQWVEHSFTFTTRFLEMHRMPNTDFLRLDNFTYMLVKSMGEFSLEQTKKTGIAIALVELI